MCLIWGAKWLHWFHRSPQNENSAPNRQRRNLEGRVLNGRYKLVRWIGGGGFADVYEARDLNIQTRTLALKVLDASDPSVAKLLRREAEKGAAVNHPNVVVVHDYAVDGDIGYIAMEYLEGRTLDKLDPLSDEMLKKFVREVCSALGR